MFDDATVKARVATVLTERANAITSPQTIAAAQGGNARYGQDTEFLVVPTNQQLAAVTPAQLKATLARFLKWEHRTSYFGPRTPAAATTAVVLGDGTLATAPKRPAKFRKPNTALVTDQKTAQAHIWLAWPRAPANDAERAAGTVFGAYIAYRWGDQGAASDPRAARHARAEQVDRAALECWKTAALGGPVIVSIVGDHQKLDDAQLGKLAPVTLVPVTKLFGY